MQKTKIIKIFAGVVLIGVIIYLIVNKKDSNVSETPTDLPNEEQVLETNNQDFVPMPSEDSWEDKKQEEGEGKLSFKAPNNYFISYPVIGECKDVVSISTQTPSDPTISVALIYKEGCVTNQDVMASYTYREVKNGYVFQTNTTNQTVREVFNKIVESSTISQ